MDRTKAERKVKWQLFLIVIFVALMPALLAIILIGDYTPLTFLRDGDLMVAASMVIFGVSSAEIITSNKKGSRGIPLLLCICAFFYAMVGVQQYHYDAYKSWFHTIINFIPSSLSILVSWLILVGRPNKRVPKRSK